MDLKNTMVAVPQSSQAIATRVAPVNEGRCDAIPRRGDSRTFKRRKSTVSIIVACVPWRHCIYPGRFLIYEARRETNKAP